MEAGRTVKDVFFSGESAMCLVAEWSKRKTGKMGEPCSARVIKFILLGRKEVCALAPTGPNCETAT